MENETSKGLFIGITLMFVAVLLVLGINVFGNAKNTMNTGSNKTQTATTMLNESQFTDYDQKVVTGNQVQSVFRSFEGEDVAICIATTGLVDLKDISKIKGTDAYGKIKDKLKEDGTAAGENFIKKVYLFSQNDDGTVKQGGAYNVNGALQKDIQLKVINYGSVLNTGNDAANSLMYREGTFYCQGGFDVDSNNNIVRNDISKNFTKTGMTEYISNTSKFNSYTIKDANGTYCGLVFVQIST